MANPSGSSDPKADKAAQNMQVFLAPNPVVSVHSDAEENWEMVRVGEEEKEDQAKEDKLDNADLVKQLVDINGVILPLWLLGLIGLAGLVIINEVLKEFKDE